MADKEKKAGRFTKIGKRIVKFFIELRAELKKVVWPDRKKLTQSTIAVVGICLFAALLIFAIDRVLSGFLGVIKFFPETSSTSTAVVSNLLPTGVPALTATIPPSSSASSVSTASSSVSGTVSSASASAS